MASQTLQHAGADPVIDLYARWLAAGELAEEAQALQRYAETVSERADLKWDTLLSAISKTPARTVAGAAARLRVALQMVAGDIEEDAEAALRAVIDDLDRLSRGAS